MTRTICPDVRNLQVLLDGAGEEPDDVVRHLENCTGCQKTLEVLAAEPDVWADTRALAIAAPEGVALRQVVERLKNEESWPPNVTDLSFLVPTDKSGVLGLLDNYEVHETIGRGGMGVVLKALDPALNRIVAIKVLSPLLASNVTARRRFVREGRAAAAVCQEHVVPVYSVSEAAGLPYLVMQYVAGESLQDRLDRAERLELVDIVRIGLQTASGLAAAHAQGLIHRDIKPANLLLENGVARVKITDFGLARTADDVQVTQAGMVAGTPEFMAPEQARAEPIDHRADLFSLGSVLYAMCTGVPPFRGSTALGVLRQVSDQAPASLRSLNPAVPAWLEALIGRLLAKDPADRIQTAAEVAALLEGYLAHLRQPATVAAPDLPFADKKSEDGQATRRRWQGFHPVAWACIVGLTGLTIAGWLLLVAAAKDEASSKWRALFKPDLRALSLEPDGDVLRTVGNGVQPDARGVRITLPAGEGKQPHSGLATAFPVPGDFEITASFQVDKADAPPTGYGVGVSIYAAVNPKTNDAVSLGRRVMPDGKAVFMADRLKPVGGKVTHKVKTMPATAATFKLRLQRVGPIVRYFVAEGIDGDNPAFVLLAEAELGTDDVRPIQTGADAGGSEAGLDAVLLDFTLGASELPEQVPVAARSLQDHWLTLPALAIVSVLVIALTGLCLKVRRSSQTESLPAEAKSESLSALVTFQCSGCAKNLKVKPELAGKKIKCPKCGRAMLAPAPTSAQGHTNALRHRKRFWPIALAVLPLILLVGLYFGFRMGRPERESRSFLGINLGAETVPDVAESGFYNQEVEGDKPFRWTDGKARLTVPLRTDEVPRSLLVNLFAPRPAGVPTVLVKVLLNQRVLFDGEISPGRWNQTFDLENTDAGAEAVIDIVSDTLVPASVPQADGSASGDGRNLGVQVHGIQLLAMAEESPRGNATANGIRDPGIVVLEGKRADVACAAIMVDGRTLAAGSPDGTVRVWEVANQRQTQIYPKLVPNPCAIALNFAGHMAIATSDGRVELWGTHSGRFVARARAGGSPMTSLAFSLDSGRLAMAGGEGAGLGELKLWGLKARKDCATVEKLPAPTRGVVFAGHGRSMAFVVDDGTAQVVDLAGKVVASFTPPQPARGVAYSADLSRLAVAHGDQGQVTIYSLAGRPVGEVRPSAGKTVVAMMFARDDRRLLTIDADATVRFWDITRWPARVVGNPQVLPQHAWVGLCYPDRLPAKTAEQGTIRIWRIDTPKTH